MSELHLNYLSMFFSLPSKTFLVGEYIALVGGPVFILNTLPRFEVSLDEILDPHQGKGGFGASTAEFLRKNFTDPLLPVDQLLETYQKKSWSGEGWKPSGADLVGQIFGKLCFFYRNENRIETFEWPFSHIYFCLIRTNYKLPTHEHLSQKFSFEEKYLSDMVLQCYRAVKEKNETDFIDAIDRYGKELARQGFLLENTRCLLEKIQQQDGVLATKGCGAMGADVILVLLKGENVRKFSEWLSQEELDMVFCGNEVSKGFNNEMVR